MIVLDYLGLLFICYAVYRALKAWADGMEHRAYIRDVMTGRSLPPWGIDVLDDSVPKGSSFRPELDAPWEEPLPVRRGIYDFDEGRHV